MAYNAGVRAVPFHRSLTLMAAIAMLLIVAAPLLSRWIAHSPEAPRVHALHAAEQVGPAPHEHPSGAHHHGSESAVAMTAHAGPTASKSAPHANHDMGVDCDYCLIAARMVSLLVAMLIALIGWRPPQFARTWVLQWGASVAAGHLGARGPPQRA
ncbi:DUF2946 family protein [Stenotrophomonas sp.]|uniref:DUF2946 family protein n=1 Tax=Stenotrophomonas sp. TaxID=69392 RepID=UPI00289D9DBD|nr:DUF2946 family protein [Stenotrophomonas sp.]